MNAFALVQAVTLTLVLLTSLLAALRALLPQTARRAQARLSVALDRPGRGAPLRRLGRWLQPAAAGRSGCGAGGGCATCGGCAPRSQTSAVPLSAQPVSVKIAQSTRIAS